MESNLTNISIINYYDAIYKRFRSHIEIIAKKINHGDFVTKTLNGVTVFVVKVVVTGSFEYISMEDMNYLLKETEYRLCSKVKCIFKNGDAYQLFKLCYRKNYASAFIPRTQSKKAKTYISVPHDDDDIDDDSVYTVDTHEHMCI